jgi:hypothetical protein
MRTRSKLTPRVKHSHAFLVTTIVARLSISANMAANILQGWSCLPYETCYRTAFTAILITGDIDPANNDRGIS